MQQLKQKLKVEINNLLNNKPYNNKQKDDWYRYFKEAYKNDNNKEKSIAIADIRFKHKYHYSKERKKYIMSKDYIERKLKRVKL